MIAGNITQKSNSLKNQYVWPGYAAGGRDSGLRVVLAAVKLKCAVLFGLDISAPFKEGGLIFESRHIANTLKKILNFTCRWCFVMEYLPEGSIRDLVRKKGPFKEETARLLSAQVALAIQHVHEKGMRFVVDFAAY